MRMTVIQELDSLHNAWCTFLNFEKGTRVTSYKKKKNTHSELFRKYTMIYLELMVRKKTYLLS